MNTPVPVVSRETMTRLTIYHDLLLKWTSRINLISKSSMSDVWNRHIWDSTQLFPLIVDADYWVDLGSGGGAPGLIISIVAQEHDTDMRVTLIESDVRKATFLRTVIRELGLNAEVIADRIDEIGPLEADVVSARALVELPTLLSYAKYHLGPTGTALFLKGETWEKEVETAREIWSFDLVSHSSRTNPYSAILEVKNIDHV